MTNILLRHRSGNEALDISHTAGTVVSLLQEMPSYFFRLLFKPNALGKGVLLFMVCRLRGKVPGSAACFDKTGGNAVPVGRGSLLGGEASLAKDVPARFGFFPTPICADRAGRQ